MKSFYWKRSKVVPVTRIGDGSYPRAWYTKARELYWAFAHSSSASVSYFGGQGVVGR